MLIRMVLYAVWRMWRWERDNDIIGLAGVLLLAFCLPYAASLLHSEPFHDELALLSKDKITAAIAMCYDAFDEGPTDQNLVEASVCPRGVANQAEAIADWTAQSIDDWRGHMADEADSRP